MKTLTCVAVVASLLSPLAMADNCRYSRNINFGVAMEGLERLSLDVGAGGLNGSCNIRVRDATGSFETGDTGSGDVDYSDVRGRVDVR